VLFTVSQQMNPAGCWYSRRRLQLYHSGCAVLLRDYSCCNVLLCDYRQDSMQTCL
jgi:hypothetical protein